MKKKSSADGRSLCCVMAREQLCQTRESDHAEVQNSIESLCSLRIDIYRGGALSDQQLARRSPTAGAVRRSEKLTC